MKLIDSIVGLRREAVQNYSSTLADPDDWLVDTLTGGQRTTDSGMRVNERLALRYPAIWRGVNLIAKDVAKLPFMVYEKEENNNRERARFHPAYPLVRRRVNPNMTWKTFVKMVTGHAVLRGNGYAWIERNRLGDVLNLVPIHPDHVAVRRDAMGAIEYAVHVGNEWRRVQPENMLHIRGLSSDGFSGYDLVGLMAETIGMGLAARQFGAKFFGNGANVSGILMVPSRLQPKAQRNLLKEWNNIATGIGKAHKVAMLKEGAKFEKLTVTPEQAQFLGTRTFENKEIALVLGVPPSKLGDPDRTSYNSLEQENLSYLAEGLDHWLTEWEDACNDKLLSAAERLEESHYFEFTRDAIIQTDTTTKTNNLISLGNNGYLLENEVREKLNLPHFPDGDRRRIPANILYVDDLQNQQDDEEEDAPPDDTDEETPDETDAETDTDTEDDDASSAGYDNPALLEKLSCLFADRVGRMIRIEQHKIVDAAHNVRNFIEWMENFYTVQEPKFAESLQPVLDTLDAYFGVSLNTQVSVNYCRESRQLLMAALDDCTQSELPETLSQLVSQWDSRAGSLSSALMEEYHAELQSHANQ